MAEKDVTGVDALVQRLEQLEAEVDSLRGQGRRSPDEAGRDNERVSRRRLIGMAGAAAAGATSAALLSASPAGAADNGNFILGNDNTAGPGITRLTSSAIPALEVIGTTVSSTSFVFNAQNTGNGIAGRFSGGTDIASVLLVPGASAGPFVTTSPGRIGVDTNGRWFMSEGPTGSVETHKLAPLVPLAAPVRVFDSRAGQPNQSPNTQGSLTFTAAAPSAANRLVRCSKDASTGATVVPSQARTLLLNLAIVTLSGIGTLAVYADGATQPNAASINWSAGGQVLSNSVTTACDTSQDIRVAIVSSAGASTHFIIDVVGYYF